MALVDTHVEVRAWLDRLAIQDLIYRHCDAVTLADWGQLEVLYAADAVWEEPALGLRYESAAALVEMPDRSCACHQPHVRRRGAGDDNDP
jgi:hypothetical protein